MVEIVLLRMKVKPGISEWFVNGLARIMMAEQKLMAEGGAVGRALRRWLNESVEPILKGERMYTESLFLERNDDDLFLLCYMEAESMAGIWEGYLDSGHPITWISEWVMERIFEEPEKLLTPDVESDYPLLVHAWGPDRP
jgi:hypothetical protein